MATTAQNWKKDIQLDNLTPGNWPLFETLMGEKGGCGGCWCMHPRLSAKEFTDNKYEGNKKKIKAIVASGQPVGLLAIYRQEAIGWIALSPREHLTRIERSRTLKRIDDRPVWSISCFFIKKEYRNKGLSQFLINGAVDYARQQGIHILEGYPVVPYDSKVPAPFLWTGILSTFTACGFKVVQQHSKSKAMVRLEVGGLRSEV